MARKASHSDISDEEWALVAPYLTLMTEDTPQREPRVCARSSMACVGLSAQVSRGG